MNNNLNMYIPFTTDRRLIIDEYFIHYRQISQLEKNVIFNSGLTEK